MGKMMSILEKYKFVEKDTSTTDEEVSSFATSEEAVEVTPEIETEETIKVQEIIEEPPTMPNPISEEDIKKAATYDRHLSIKEIYTKYDLDTVAVTDSVYLLENLINALPAELPDFVKKTTVNNIIKASAMNIDKLLDDGHTRSTKLKGFIDEYTTANLNDIENLKQEIDRLNAIIAEYHQQVRLKEKLIQEETTLVETEETRIHNILNFFKN
ncbi:hypothetical protein QTL86_01320 [Cellulosilyticum sp. ST5]|uniref:hypothetical protein n=1 Tax=unclassified Cellulosilyticum TaxID=2643091 RepID=UPI000F8D7A6E|nr:hypothetical protein [Cellulosilyticum sp. WCF-2]QEH70279.1 hypothetical protein EKH84_18520 [Cellulosilyticum sp. WCF-2]